MRKDINYLWFCLKCQDYHRSPDCPKDKIVGEEVIIIPEPDDEWDDYLYGFG